MPKHGPNRRKRVPKLSFLETQGIGWHVSYRDPATGSPRRHRFGIVAQNGEERARALYHAWVAKHLGAETALPTQNRPAKPARPPGPVPLTGSLIDVGGSPTEPECLEIRLRVEHPVIVCPARNVEGMRIPAAWKPAIAAGRILITSPFEKTVRRATAATADERNRFVVLLADAIFIPHAAPGGSLERLCQDIPATGKPLWTLNDPANAPLVALGAQLVAKDSGTFLRS